MCHLRIGFPYFLFGRSFYWCKWGAKGPTIVLESVSMLWLSAIELLLCWVHQFVSVVWSTLTLCDPMECSTPGFAVHHKHPELAQTHDHRVSDAILPSNPL